MAHEKESVSVHFEQDLAGKTRYEMAQILNIDSSFSANVAV